MNETNKRKPGPTPRLDATTLRALIGQHRGNVKALARAIGMSRGAVINSIRREHLEAEVEAARRGWAVEVPEVEASSNAAYPVAEVMAARRATLGARLKHGESSAVIDWLMFVRWLRVSQLLPADTQIEPGVIMALERGDVTADFVLAAYGPAFLAEVLTVGGRT